MALGSWRWLLLLLLLLYNYSLIHLLDSQALKKDSNDTDDAYCRKRQGSVEELGGWHRDGFTYQMNYGSTYDYRLKANRKQKNKYTFSRQGSTNESRSQRELRISLSGCCPYMGWHRHLCYVKPLSHDKYVHNINTEANIVQVAAAGATTTILWIWIHVINVAWYMHILSLGRTTSIEYIP